VKLTSNCVFGSSGIGSQIRSFVGLNWFNKSKDDYQEKYEKAKKAAEETSDANFIEELVPLASVMKTIVEKFRQAYRDWKKTIIEAHLDKSTNLNENYMYFPKYTGEQQYICKNESKKLKEKLEALYSAK